MTLASDPFELMAAAGRQERPASTVRSAGAELWRGLQRLCTVARRDDGEASSTMAERSWQAGFAAMWDQDELDADGATRPAPDQGGLKFL